MPQPYQPLYLKYRPQALNDLVGQTSVLRTLTNAIEHDRISHAYLFTGPRGTGKTSSARILAKSLNCEQGPTAQPCLQCSSCLEVKVGNSPSVFEIDAASNNSVDDARALIERAPLVAQGGRFKLYIIDECHMLTKEAFNALLKTIEEPPPRVVFILATTEEHKVPPTIVSRCQRLMFKLVNQEDLSAHLRKIAQLENIRIEETALQLIARRSGGGLRDALGLLDQASLLASEEKAVAVNDLLVLLGAVHEDVLLDISAAVQKRDGHRVLSAINALFLEGREPAVLAFELAKHFLNLTKASYVNESGQVTVESIRNLVLGSDGYLERLVAQAKLFDRSELSQMVEYLDKLEQSCRRSTQPTLSVEMGLLSLCHRHDIAYLKEIDQRLQAVENELAADYSSQPSARPSKPFAPSTAPSIVQPQTSILAAKTSDQTLETRGPIVREVQSNASFESPKPQFNNSGQPASKIDLNTIRADESNKESNKEYLDTDSAGFEIDSVPISRPEFQPELQLNQPNSIDSSQEQIGREPVKSSGANDIDEFWSDLQDELQKRSIPTFSIVKVHAFPLVLEKEEFVLGVRTEYFQKSLESKIEHLKAACTAVMGRAFSVRLKVVNDTPAKPQARSKDHKTEAKSTVSPEKEEPERSIRPDLSDQLSIDRSAPPPAIERTKTIAPVVESSHDQSKAPLREQPKAPDPDASLTGEAYKLFEGPGSRLIG